MKKKKMDPVTEEKLKIILESMIKNGITEGPIIRTIREAISLIDVLRNTDEIGLSKAIRNMEELLHSRDQRIAELDERLHLAEDVVEAVLGGRQERVYEALKGYRAALASNDYFLEHLKTLEGACKRINGGDESCSCDLCVGRRLVRPDLRD